MTCQSRLVLCASHQTAQQRVGCSRRGSGLRPPMQRLSATDRRPRPLSRSAKPVAIIRREYGDNFHRANSGMGQNKPFAMHQLVSGESALGLGR